MATFSQLPAELLLYTMALVDSTTDLHSLISASPECLHILVRSRNQILTAILKCNISPGAHRAAIFACQVPSFSRDKLRFKARSCFLDDFYPNLSDPDAPYIRHARRKAITAYTEKYFSKNKVDFPTDSNTIVRLCRLQRQMLLFVDKYVHLVAMRPRRCAGHPWLFEDPDAMPQKNPDLRYPDNIAPLSHKGRAEIEKAFCNREIFTKIFFAETSRSVPRGPSADFNERERFQLFQGKLTTHESEALTCVIDYMYYLNVGEYVLPCVRATERRLFSGWI